jgi:SAM-dependent methyltransferase
MPVSAIQTQYVSCYNCGSSDTEPYDEENGWQLVKCLGCGLLYVNPRPADSEITQATKTGEHRGEQGTLDWVEVYQPKKVRKYQRVLRDLFGPSWRKTCTGSWLDIGCGYGEFVEALNTFTSGRLTTIGTEPNTHKRTHARQRGLNVTELDLDAHNETYDYWSLLNVFSHLPDPVGALNHWKRLLKPHGEIVLQTGDSADLPRKDHHRPYMLPDHLSFVTEKIACEILDRIGFEIINVRKYYLPIYPALTPLELAKAMARIFRPGMKPHFRVMFNPPMRPNRDMYIRARMR